MMRYLILFALVALINHQSYSQCNRFARKNVKPLLEGYDNVGKTLSTVSEPGYDTDVMLTFFSGQEYRIAFGADEELFNAYFMILDTEENIVYNSKEDGNSKVFDFSTNITRQLIIRIVTPEIHSEDRIMGCVAVITGFN